MSGAWVHTHPFPALVKQNCGAAPFLSALTSPSRQPRLGLPVGSVKSLKGHCVAEVLGPGTQQSSEPGA